MIEWLYSLNVKKGGAAKAFLWTYIGSTILNAVPAGSETPWADFVNNLNPKNNWSPRFMAVALVLFLLLKIGDIVLKKAMSNQSIPHRLTEYMNSSSSANLALVSELQGYAWGYDKVLHMAPDVFAGWKPEDLVIEKIEGTNFSFGNKDREMKDGYQEYCRSEVYRSAIEKGNNNTRWMLVNAMPNFSKTDKKMYLTVRSTDWCMTSYVWNYFRNNVESLQNAVKKAYEGAGGLYPNSLCLHLVIVTADEKALLTRIANTKRNDYPSKWAATIGEQLEKEDFVDGPNIDGQFIRNWVRRAFMEEFGIEKREYDTIVDDGSIRVLSINMEADIYNFSLMTVVQLRYSFQEFDDYLRKTIVKDKEFINMEALKVKDIPSVMAKYKTIEAIDAEYHPSTFLRLFMCYIHYYGIDHFTDEYAKCYQKKG